MISFELDVSKIEINMESDIEIDNFTTITWHSFDKLNLLIISTDSLVLLFIGI